MHWHMYKHPLACSGVRAVHPAGVTDTTPAQPMLGSVWASAKRSLSKWQDPAEVSSVNKLRIAGVDCIGSMRLDNCSSFSDTSRDVQHTCGIRID